MRTFAVMLLCVAAPPQSPPPGVLPRGIEITRVIPLRRASAQAVVDIIQEVLDASRRATRLRGWQGGCALPAEGHWDAIRDMPVETGPRFAADRSTNAVILTLHPESLDDLDHVTALIARLDADLVVSR